MMLQLLLRDMMAQVPVEIAQIGRVRNEELRVAIVLANSLQNEFLFINLAGSGRNPFSALSYRQSTVKDLIDDMTLIRKKIRGYHPFIIGFVDTALRGEKFENLFGSIRANEGIGVVTTDLVEENIIPKGRMAAYFLYYLARYSLSFMVPGHKNHEDTRECLFDRKVTKSDILKSMKAHALCDDCRSRLLIEAGTLSADQLQAVDRLLEESGKLLTGETLVQDLESSSNMHSQYEAIEELEKIKSRLDTNAENKAKRFGLLCLLIFVSIVVLLGLLTYQLGWDQMEPWTYFIAILGTLGTYAYFVVTNREWSLRAIYHQIVERNKKANYFNYGFNVEKFERLTTDR